MDNFVTQSQHEASPIVITSEQNMKLVEDISFEEFTTVVK